MANLAEVVRRIRKERDRAQKKIEQLDEALRALTGVSRGGSNQRRTRAQTSGKYKPMSAAARKRIAAAQRARWAKWKAAQKSS
jgi:hypothetical protein